MAPSGPDASNCCLPPKSPVIQNTPPLPLTSRGDRLGLGCVSKTNQLTYPSGKMIVLRSLKEDKSLVYRGHSSKTTSCESSPSGCYMASGDDRGNLRVWALDTEEHLTKYTTVGLTSAITDIQWDGESKRVAFCGERSNSGSGGDSAKCIMYDTGNTVGALSQHMKGRISSLAFKKQRPMRIATAGKDDGKIYFHKGPPFAKIPAQEGVPCETAHSKGLHCVRYNKAGSLVVSVGTDRSITVYEGKTLQLLKTTPAVHSATIYSVAWNPDDSSILTASGDGTCKLLQVNATDGSLKELKTWTPAEFQLGKAYEKVPVGGNQVGAVYCGEDLVSVSLNGQLTILPASGNDYQVLTGHNAPIAGLVAGKDTFYTGDTDGILCEWNWKTGKAQKRVVYNDNQDLMYVTHTGAISGVSLAGDSLVSVGWDDMLRSSSGASKLAAQPVCMASGSKVSVICTVQGLQTVAEDGSLSDLFATSYEALSVCVSRDDSTAYVGGNDCSIHIYSLKAGKLEEIHVIEGGHLKPVSALELSHGGNLLAAGDGRDVLVWDVANKYASVVGKGRWCFHVQKVSCLAWSPNDDVLASGGADDSIYLWSVNKKSTRVHYKYSHRGGVTGLAFANEGYRMVSSGADAVVNLWDVTDDVAAKFG